MILSKGIQTPPNEPDYMHITFAQLVNGEAQKMEDFEIIEAMEKYGGNFVKAIAKACYCADGFNYMKLRGTFPEIFEEYKKFLTK